MSFSYRVKVELGRCLLANETLVAGHPNVKVFIYHGGMLGITEAVYAGTPMVLIPVFGDQPTNAALLQEKGLAVVLRLSDVTKKTLLASLRKVLHEPRYHNIVSTPDPSMNVKL